MTEKIKINKTTVDNLRLPESGQTILWDSELLGFGIRLTQGAKSYVVQKRVQGKPVRVTIGRHGQLTPDMARKQAAALLGDMSQGVNPHVERRSDRERGVILQECIKDFFASRPLKERTAYNYRNIIKVCFSDWMDKPLCDISKDDIEHRYEKIGAEHGKPYSNFAMRVMRSVMNFGMAKYEEAIDENPVSRLSQTRSWHPIKRREDYIKPTELKSFLDGVEKLDSELIRDYLKLLLFTGLRREEAASLPWADVDFNERTIIIRETKNNLTLRIPMSDYIESLLKRRSDKRGDDTFVFQSSGKKGYIADVRRQMANLRKKTGISDLRVHGLRRTFATIAESQDISTLSLKRLLNHKQGDVTTGYIIMDVERLRTAQQKITDTILALSGSKAN
jgi:integrase